MNLVLGTLTLCVTAVYFAIVFLGCRNPKKPFWASQAWVAFHAFIQTTVWFASICYLVSFLINPAATQLLDYAISGGALLATVVFLKSLNVKKRLGRFSKPGAPAAHAM